MSEIATENRSVLAEQVEALGHFLREPMLELLRQVLHRTEALRGVMQAYGATVAAQANLRELAPVPAQVAGPRRPSPSPAQPLASCVWGERTSRDRASSTAAGSLEESVPILYRGQQIGCVVLTFADAARWSRLHEEKTLLGRELGLLLIRQDLRWRVRRSLNLDVPLAGVSQALRTLEVEIEKVGSVIYPVILEGEFGSHDLQIAAAIHFSSDRRDGPFELLDCAYRNPASFDRDLRTARARAGGGSLMLSAIDLLDFQSQRQLLWMVREEKNAAGRSESVRLIASTNQPLEALAKRGAFCRLLKTELDFLHLHIPPLRARREDIPHLLEGFFERYSQHGRKQLLPEAMAACAQYDWPENESELERMAARIAVMAESDTIGLEELRRFVSWLPARTEGQIVQAPVVEREPELEPEGDLLEEETAGTDELTASERHQLGDLSRKLVAGNFEDLQPLAMGMQRALRFLGTHFVEDISLGQLAKEAHVSPSHLSFLFKRALGVPFKAVLAAVRIEKAQQLLTSGEQQSITDISLDVGFGDLSHFERTFKRLVGTNPREYRRQQAERRLKAAGPGPARHTVYVAGLHESPKSRARGLGL
ncbi:MAG TPA: helix-turn-helix domain-containing protein [Acidobacteriaceae bacterium]|nr:helix-turn-helix domain-containing protein [Acidobacteriaceae bacterium]